MNIGAALILVGVLFSLLNLARNYRPPRHMTESQLIDRGLWDECSGEPMNKWAEEFDRRDYGWPNM